MTGTESRGQLFVISAPSGTGKTSLARRMLESLPSLEFSVSYTTRPCRPGEVDGREYHFIDDARFDAMIRDQGFLEWASIFGRRYGTGRAAIESTLAAGRDVLLDIDVQGERQVRDTDIPSVSIFIMPPDFTTLASRLRLRGSERDGEIARRLGEARAEAEEYVYYDYVVVNDDLERAARELGAIVRAESCRRERRAELVRRVLESFPARPARVTEP